MECPPVPDAAFSRQVEFHFTGAGSFVNNQDMISSPKCLLHIAGEIGNKKLIAGNCEVNQVFLPGCCFQLEVDCFVRALDVKK